jgi:PilZ domain
MIQIDLMKERRYSNRRAVNIPATFRILREGQDLTEMRLSAPIQGRIRDLGLHGLALETTQEPVDGLRLDKIVEWNIKARIFVQWQMPDGGLITVVAETAWCEPIFRASAHLMHVGLRFREFSIEAREAIKTFLQTPG